MRRPHGALRENLHWRACSALSRQREFRGCGHCWSAVFDVHEELKLSFEFIYFLFLSNLLTSIPSMP
jgi:hypothetical protein